MNEIIPYRLFNPFQVPQTTFSIAGTLEYAQKITPHILAMGRTQNQTEMRNLFTKGCSLSNIESIFRLAIDYSIQSQTSRTFALYFAANDVESKTIVLTGYNPISQRIVSWACTPSLKVLGLGQFSTISEIDFLSPIEHLGYSFFPENTPFSFVMKYPKNNNVEYIAHITKEMKILEIAHSQGIVEGVQKPPIGCFPVYSNVTLRFITSIFLRYDFNLNALNQFSITQREKAVKIASLFAGLSHLHQKGIVVRDIKPENMCSQNGEYQLCDFGSAEEEIKVSAAADEGLLGPHTFIAIEDELRIFKLVIDILRAKGISEYALRENIKIKIEKMLDSARTANEHFYSDNIIEESIERLLAIPSDIPTVQPYIICKSYDVFCLGKSIREILGDDFLSNYPHLGILIYQMSDYRPDKRPCIEEATERYNTLLRAYNLGV